MRVYLRQRVSAALLAVGLAAVALTLGWSLLGVRGGAGYVPAPPFARLQELGGFSQNFVRVDLALERDDAGMLLIAATFTPDEPSSHLYSSELPRDGIDGAGRPTRLLAEPQAALRPLSPATADQRVVLQQLEGFSQPFPVYPDGPVTLRLPVALQSAARPLQARLLVSYMACSSQGYCFPPVVDRPVTITVREF